MDPFDKLTNTLNKRMNETASTIYGTPFELGEITSDYGLKISRLGANTIPNYLISSSIAINKIDINVQTSLVDSHSHTVTVTLPEQKVRPGDRVLVMWDGMQPIVVSVLVSSDVLKGGS